MVPTSLYDLKADEKDKFDKSVDISSRHDEKIKMSQISHEPKSPMTRKVMRVGVHNSIAEVSENYDKPTTPRRIVQHIKEEQILISRI